MAEVVPLRDYVAQRFEDNEHLYTERDERLREAVEHLREQVERERVESDRRLEKLEQGKASGDTLDSYQRWQRALVYGLVGTAVTVLVTLGLAVYSFTHGAVP